VRNPPNQQPVFVQMPHRLEADPDEETPAELRALGQRLRGQIPVVLTRTIERNNTSGLQLGPEVEERFRRIGEISTEAVASWMAGASPDEAISVGQEVWAIFGQLAAQRAAPLAEVTKRVWRWRDATHEVLAETATAHSIGAQALERARWMIETSLRLTLVQLCDYFDAERGRTDQELKRRQDELTFMATHDTLTGLPNRALILDRLQQMLLRARPTKAAVAALFIDLDNFKAINDTLGHIAGDEVLQVVAARFDGLMRDLDAVGRLGGDEFIVVASDISRLAGTEPVAERLLDALRKPIALGEQETAVTVTASIGIAAADHGSAAELVRDADIALYQAKLDGRNTYVVFEAGMAEAVQSKLGLDVGVGRAMTSRSPRLSTSRDRAA